MDIIARLEMCLNAPEGSPTEDETEKAIRAAIEHIRELRAALDLVDDLGFYRHLLEEDKWK